MHTRWVPHRVPRLTLCRGPAGLLLDPPDPVPRTASPTNHGHNRHPIIAHNVRERVRESLDANLTDLELRINAIDQHARPRPPSDPIHRSIDSSDEHQAEPDTTLFVPRARVSQLADRFGRQADRQAHPVNSSATESRTISHGAACDSPEITASARRSISSAQATSSPSSSSPAGPSRLASNAAANSARSSSANARAWRRTSSALIAMDEDYPTERSGPKAPRGLRESRLLRTGLRRVPGTPRRPAGLDRSRALTRESGASCENRTHDRFLTIHCPTVRPVSGPADPGPWRPRRTTLNYPGRGGCAMKVPCGPG